MSIKTNVCCFFLITDTLNVGQLWDKAYIRWRCDISVKNFVCLYVYFQEICNLMAATHLNYITT